MAFIKEPAKSVKVYGKFETVVCGGGPAGIGAALAAARNGAKTILIEQAGFLGGMATGGLVPCYAPFSRGPEPLLKGIALELMDSLKAIDGVGDYKNSIWWVAIDPEKYKLLLDRKLAEAGVKVLYFTFVSDIKRKNGKLEGVYIENKSGRQIVLGKTFVDATGDADVAFKCGVPFEKGDENGRMQPGTCCFAVAGVDDEKFKAFRKKFNNDNSKISAAYFWKDEGKKILPRLKYGEYRFIAIKPFGNGYWVMNFGHVFGIDGTKTEDLSLASPRGRELANNFVKYARIKIPGFKNAHLVNVAPYVGIRETRRIKGEYRMTVNDYLKQTRFDDTIAIYDYTIDVHNTDKSKKAFKKAHENFTKNYVLPAGAYYSVPFRILVPQGMDNLLVAGRSVSSDRLTQGALRVMPLCTAMGEAAGIACAMALKKENRMKETDIKLLQKKLLEQGARLK